MQAIHDAVPRHCRPGTIHRAPSGPGSKPCCLVGPSAANGQSAPWLVGMNSHQGQGCGPPRCGRSEVEWQWRRGVIASACRSPLLPPPHALSPSPPCRAACLVHSRGTAPGALTPEPLGARPAVVVGRPPAGEQVSRVGLFLTLGLGG